MENKLKVQLQKISFAYAKNTLDFLQTKKISKKFSSIKTLPGF